MPNQQQQNQNSFTGMMGYLNDIGRLALLGYWGYDMLRDQYLRQQQIRAQQEEQRRAQEAQAQQDAMRQQQQFIYGLTEPNMYF